MSGGVSGGRVRNANGGSGQPNGAVAAPNGGASTTGVVRAASGITKPEADVFYVNVDGDQMEGLLALTEATVAGNPLALDPAADNALTWTATGLYAPPAPEVTIPPEYLTEEEAAARFVELAGDAMSGPLSIAGKNVGVSTGDQNRLIWDATGFYVPPEFVDHSASHDWYFSTNTTITSDPGQGNMRSNTGNLQTATELSLDLLTNDGMDMSAVISTLQSGDVMLVQDKDQGNNWVRYALAAAPSLQTGYWRLTVTRQAGAGTLSTAQLMAVVFWVENLPAPVDVAITGDNGVGVVESPTNTFALTTRVSGTAGNQVQLQAGGLYVPATPLPSHDHTAADGGALTNDEHDGYSQFTNLGADPATPATNRIRVYSKDNGSGIATLYYRAEDGTIYELPTLTTGGGGSGAPANASYITTAAESKLSGERVLGSAVIMSGLLSARPSAGTAGRLFLATDTDLVYRDTGSTWETFATRAGAAANDIWVSFVVDGGGSAITTGQKGHFLVPAGTILESRLLADQSGSVVVDLWRDTFTNAPPTAGDSICASAKPTLSSALKAQDTTLTGWSKTLTDGDILAVNVDSAATVQRLTVALKIRKS